jgi:hypothetical protein
MYHGSNESCKSKLKGGGGWVINKPPIQDERKSTDEYVGKKKHKHEALELQSLRAILVL